MGQITVIDNSHRQMSQVIVIGHDIKKVEDAAKTETDNEN